MPKIRFRATLKKDFVRSRCGRCIDCTCTYMYMTSTPITPHVEDACIRYRVDGSKHFCPLSASTQSSDSSPYPFTLSHPNPHHQDPPPTNMSRLLTPLKDLQVLKHHIPAHGLTPNTSIQDKPLMIYKSAFVPSVSASDIESHLRAVGVVEPQWRYTMFSTSHFHVCF